METLVGAGAKPGDYLKKIEGTPKASAWKSRLNSYKPNPKAVKELSEIRRKFMLVSFSAHWCKDCLQNIPALINSLRDARNPHIELIMLDMDCNKKIAEDAEVRAIPTVIVYDSQGVEVARIIENPSEGFASMEEELASILTARK